MKHPQRRRRVVKRRRRHRLGAVAARAARAALRGTVFDAALDTIFRLGGHTALAAAMMQRPDVPAIICPSCNGMAALRDGSSILDSFNRCETCGNRGAVMNTSLGRQQLHTAAAQLERLRSFVQLGTVTGRLSSAGPNISNLPRPSPPPAPKTWAFKTSAPAGSMTSQQVAKAIAAALNTGVQPMVNVSTHEAELRIVAMATPRPKV